MRAGLHHASVVDDEDQVRVADRREAVRDHQGGASFERLVECALHGDLGLGVEVSGGLVEDDDGRCLEQQSGDREPLPLSAGQPVAAVADHGVQPVGQLRNQRLDLRRCECGPDLLLSGTRSRVLEIDPDRVVEHVRVLGHVPDRVLQ